MKETFSKNKKTGFFLLLFCWFTFFLKTAQRCVLKGMEAQEHYLKGFYIISDMEFKRSVSQDAWPSADIKLQANLTGGGKKGKMHSSKGALNSSVIKRGR